MKILKISFLIILKIMKFLEAIFYLNKIKKEKKFILLKMEKLKLNCTEIVNYYLKFLII